MSRLPYPDPHTARRVIREAASWYSQLCSGQSTLEEKQAWQSWLSQGWEQQWAWSRVENLQRQLGVAPGDVTRNVLESSAEEMRAQRRALLKGAGAVAIACPVAWYGWQARPWQPLLADYRTATGERREWLLDDGTRLVLNTDSAVDIVFDAHQRLVKLIRGEIFIETGHGDAAQGKSFVVQTAHASLRALGTQFAVRLHADSTWLAVMQHAVEITLPSSASASLILAAGQQATIDDNGVDGTLLLAGNEVSWLRGMLVVTDWRLADLAAELGRYRRGSLRCDSRLADRRISGAFPLDDTDMALQAIQAALPMLQIDYLTRYWVTLRPAKD
ncbi:FecR domain-containing protein [Methylobacillus arboreus]|uniref:FecR domain-containing protein n=1 Tax=Methylobacillus arboreus TaxID=755170 RepID=UPI001E53641D|nr:FecR domain-containing protein [Methylobacillus arboreus]MCB5190929.1 FecR domain-containing protein [Methylobacillus arboreus]